MIVSMRDWADHRSLWGEFLLYSPSIGPEFIHKVEGRTRNLHVKEDFAHLDESPWDLLEPFRIVLFVL